jgi:integrase
MNPVRKGLRQYLALREALGFQLRDIRWGLNQFVDFLEARGISRITTGLAVEWATKPASVQPATWAWRLGIVRQFAAWLSAQDPRTEVPPQGLLPYQYRRRPPYIYSIREIEQLIQTAAALPSSGGLRGRTYSTLFGLLAITGMRIGEAVALNRDDVNLVEGTLVLRKSKFGKSRLVYVHPSTQRALEAYADARDRFCPCPQTQAFFLLERRTRVTKNIAEWTFAQVSREVGLRLPGKSHGKGPRLHDLRHSFASRTLINWYRAGLDVEREIPKLASYLGHRSARDTYWYIEAVPELLQLATQRLEKAMTGGSL